MELHDTLKEEANDKGEIPRKDKLLADFRRKYLSRLFYFKLE